MANGLAAAFVADNAAHNILVSSTLNGSSWSPNTDIGQPSNGSAPALAVFGDQLWVAFTWSSDTQNVLVCSSADGVQWTEAMDTGQASNGSAPALAVFDNRLWVAFIADNDTGNVLVCSSADGVHWSEHTDIGQASNGSGPALAVFDNRLWVAFIADNDSQNVLVCCYPDALGGWSANTDIGQASNGSGPALAVFDNQLWVAFIADNDSRNVLVCSSANGFQWTENTDIGQASNGSAPSLAVFGIKPPLLPFENRLWVAFIADNDSQNVLVCSYPDALGGWSPNTDIGQASNGSAPSLAAFGGFFVRECPPPSSASEPVGAPSAGLGSNSNYLLYNADYQPILDLSISICISEDIVGDIGFAFQLNAYSPKEETTGWQQYGMTVEHGAEITGFVNNWPWDPLGAPNLINDYFPLCPLAGANTLPAGYQLTVTLANDADGNVTGATYIVVDRQNVTQAEIPISLLAIAPTADIAPIIAFELNLVGPINSEHAVLSSGAGTITYSASSPLTVANALPPEIESAVGTAETANSFYGELPAGPASQFTQWFTTRTNRK